MKTIRYVCLENIKQYLTEDGIDINIFDQNDLECFLSSSLLEFNATPPFTNISLDDFECKNNYSCIGIISVGAEILAQATKKLIEDGKAFSIKDNETIKHQSYEITNIIQNDMFELFVAYTQELKNKQL